ncbi:hypothetical protein [Methylophilus sp. 3sh_L]|uniref:hypothetical protein n=1 Tax=Methylophilus sp. 3sh_L TaxID=3377114 RepID=UPI00398F6351
MSEQVKKLVPKFRFPVFADDGAWERKPLSSLDDLITAQNQKVEALKQHKKGLMQQLFPDEGETVPKLRFPEFENDGEWVEVELGSLTTKVGSGITPTGGDKNYKKSGRPFVRSQNVGWGELLLEDIVFIDEVTHESFISTEIKIAKTPH